MFEDSQNFRSIYGSLHPFGPKTAIEKPDCSSSPVY